MSESGREALTEVVGLLDLEQIEENIFRGLSPKGRTQRVFGGQVLGQALAAAIRTVDPSRHCHSLHAYFLRPGDPRIPILYEVDCARDGKSFTARRVVAVQHGKQIFNLAASFQIPETGFDHQFEMPKVPEPEELEDAATVLARRAHEFPEGLREWILRPRPFETRPVILDGPGDRPPRPPYDNIWFRAAGPVPGDIRQRQILLAYVSDMTLLDTSLLPHGKSFFSAVQMASIDHAMWFHRDAPLDEWLLYAQDSPSASGARGFNRGLIFTRAGRLIASVAQEGLIRPRGA
ncbi:MAG TPA: acyl-CoA thioesterase II [Rhizomicrobium sp.]|jgi:acyl-CoA thioesterase II|nr:acyl-CoA thioesterase II [Rhizomicrobium sp.]